MMKLRPLAAALALGLAVTTVPTIALAEDIDLGDGPAVAGMAWDEDTGRLFVSREDAPGEVQLLDEAGESVGTITFSAQPESVQAVNLEDGQLYVADIGDPQLERELVVVYGMNAEEGQQGYRAWDFEFPDGPQDATAFLVSGRGRFYFITAGADPGIYRADLEPSRSSVNTLVRAADAPEGVTDATFLDDGATMLVRTGDGVVLINAFTWETTDTTTYAEGPGGESITQFGEGRMLVGSGGVLRDEPLPDGETTVTPAAAPASPSESPSASPETSPKAGATGTPAPPTEAEVPAADVSRGGTLLALAGAVVVAVVAGALVFISRD